MNLQITVPYQTCPFKCPFCIANDPKVQSAFENLYQTNGSDYFEALCDTIEEHMVKTVVITGDTEPTLNMKWVEQVIECIKENFPWVKIEIQTRNYNEKILQYLGVLDLDVVAISVYCHEQLDLVRDVKLSSVFGVQKRAVVVLNRQFNQTMANYRGFDQVTIKQIQYGNNEQINKWIKENWVPSIIDDNLLEDYPMISFMYDENCMDNKDRYLIFRENGKTYADWATTQSM